MPLPLTKMHSIPEMLLKIQAASNDLGRFFWPHRNSDLAELKRDCQIVPRVGELTQKDVKNEDRSDYVYENTGEMTKCILQKRPFLHESAPNGAAIDENRANLLAEHAESPRKIGAKANRKFGHRFIAHGVGKTEEEQPIAGCENREAQERWRLTGGKVARVPCPDSSGPRPCQVTAKMAVPRSPAVDTSPHRLSAVSGEEMNQFADFENRKSPDHQSPNGSMTR